MFKTLKIFPVLFLMMSLSCIGQSSYWSPNLPNGATAVTNPNPYDFTNQVATDAFVVRTTNLQMGTAPMSSITGGTYSFNSSGTGALANYTASGGTITNVLVWIPSGSGYQVGDVITFQAGNYDSLVQITAVNGSNQPTAGTILYGGTGYSSGTSISETGANGVQFTFLLSGTLTSNATFVMPFGTYLSTSNQWIWANNTTGSFTVTVCQAASAGANTCGGRSVLIPQGTNNSNSQYIQTDGVVNVDLASHIPLIGTVTFTTATTDNATINGVTASSHCVFSPTNATAAAATTIAYISATSANTVTFTHVVTTASGGTENISCTPY
jgi:hypothetical protein